MIQFIQSNANSIVGTLTLASNALFALVILATIFHSETSTRLHNFVHRYILELVFWSSLSAVIGSLIYSNIVNYPPCDLCWIQRIFIYPQTILSFIAMRRKDKGIIDYLFPLSAIGLVVAGFHSLVQWGLVSTSSIGGCVSEGGACAKVFVLEYSYITIPFMSFSVFAYIIFLKLIYYRKNKRLASSN